MMCERALSRESHGKVIAEHQMVQQAIADSYAEYNMLRLLVLWTAWTIDNSSTPRGSSADRRVQVFVREGAARHRVPRHPHLRFARRHPPHTAPGDVGVGADAVHHGRARRGPQGDRRQERAAGLYEPHEGNWPTEFLPAEARGRRSRSSPTSSQRIPISLERVDAMERRTYADIVLSDVELPDIDALTDWVGDRLPGTGRFSLQRMGQEAGIANALYLIGRDGHQWVLRRPPAVKNDPSAANTVREWRILRCLEGTPVPHPTARLLCEDPDVIGATFMIMDLRRRLHAGVRAAAHRSPPTTRFATTSPWPTSTASSRWPRSTGSPAGSRDSASPTASSNGRSRAGPPSSTATAPATFPSSTSCATGSKRTDPT